jgi:hypothetical protein
MADSLFYQAGEISHPIIYEDYAQISTHDTISDKP